MSPRLPSLTRRTFQSDSRIISDEAKRADAERQLNQVARRWQGALAFQRIPTNSLDRPGHARSNTRGWLSPLLGFTNESWKANRTMLGSTSAGHEDGIRGRFCGGRVDVFYAASFPHLVSFHEPSVSRHPAILSLRRGEKAGSGACPGRFMVGEHGTVAQRTFPYPATAERSLKGLIRTL